MFSHFSYAIFFLSEAVHSGVQNYTLLCFVFPLNFILIELLSNWAGKNISLNYYWGFILPSVVEWSQSLMQVKDKGGLLCLSTNSPDFLMTGFCLHESS